MASGKLLRQLVRYGASGDVHKFRAAAEAAIEEERQKQHHLLANDLERLLYAEHMSLDGNARVQQQLSQLPSSREGERPLLEQRPVVREEADIILAEQTAQALADIMREHQRADVLRAHGLQPATKLLFFGPPGCGKTVAAEVLANGLNLPLVLVRLDSLVSSFLGETSANLRRVFDFVAETPVVALFDEFDALTKDRGDSSDHGELKRAVNAVLQMMDSYRGSSILIATTNYASLLDRAIWRRFDEILRFDKPDEEQIKRLLARKLAGVRRNFECDDVKILETLNGLAHAEIERVLRRAIKEMILAGCEFLESADLIRSRRREDSFES